MGGSAGRGTFAPSHLVVKNCQTVGLSLLAHLALATKDASFMLTDTGEMKTFVDVRLTRLREMTGCAVKTKFKRS